MSTKETGGPAFPATEEHGLNSGMPGMELRDYFAAQVLIGLSIRREGKSDADDARNAYALADAMLKARKS